MGAVACATLVAGSDFSAGSQSALTLAVAWAERFGARLEVAHVAPPQLNGRAHGPLAAELRALAVQAGADRLSHPTGTIVTGGDPATVLSALARQAGGWVVAGCEGASATLLRQAGSVTSSLAETPVVPALVAPPRWSPPTDAGSAPFTRILAGLSLDERDLPLLDFGATLAQATGASLSVAHAIPVDAGAGYPAAQRELLRQAAGQAATAAERSVRELLERALPVEFAATAGVQVHVVRQGPAWRDLAGLAVSQDADLLVVGGGRTAARLVAATPCPLLVLPAWSAVGQASPGAGA